MRKNKREERRLRVERYQAERERRSLRFKKDAKRLSKKYKSTMHYTLAALIPYTEANLKLQFSPREFFSDLAKLDYEANKKQIKPARYRSAYYRAKKTGLIEVENGIPKLTSKGERRLNLYQPKTLQKEARLLAVFDIPETERSKRNRLRTILKEFRFKQIQKSVWETVYDCRNYIEMAIEEDELKNYVILYEAAKAA